jgi:hypothetical protein
LIQLFKFLLKMGEAYWNLYQSEDGMPSMIQSYAPVPKPLPEGARTNERWAVSKQGKYGQLSYFCKIDGKQEHRTRGFHMISSEECMLHMEECLNITPPNRDELIIKMQTIKSEMGAHNEDPKLRGLKHIAYGRYSVIRKLYNDMFL